MIFPTAVLLFVLWLWQESEYFGLKENGDDQLNNFNIDDECICLSKQLDTFNCLSEQLETSDKSICFQIENLLIMFKINKLVKRSYIMGPDFFRRFFPSSQSEEFPHPTLIPSNIKKKNNLSNRIRRNSQNSTTIKTNSLNYTIHNNSFSSTTPLSLLVNQTSKTTKQNHTSEKYDNDTMSVTTPSIIGKNIVNVANLTSLTNNSLSGMAEFNSPAEKEEERKENSRGIDVWIIGSVLFFVFFMLATAYYYMSNIGSQLRRGSYGVRSMFPNNNTESAV
ncbi:uncharacterized protein LOC126841221 [Adelges cooleyi]|uniref:uncharacterized protein LOC126841221 n=1 Tax=Adelges cooleyi TaxID=133065 RepID=UPI00217F47AE|nr:uncharacterized protein LOC126837346 isoform X2 [Adelges cooleyi]XP_050433511.1 uncharacterized protein LOC126841221 [Adelges cooleyi]